MGSPHWFQNNIAFCVENLPRWYGLHWDSVLQRRTSEQIECTCHSPEPRCAAPRPRTWGVRRTPVWSYGFESSLDTIACYARASLKGNCTPKLKSDLLGFFCCVTSWRSEVRIRTGTRSNRRLKMAKKSWVTTMQPELRRWIQASRIPGCGMVLNSTVRNWFTTAGRPRSDSSWSWTFRIARVT